MTEFKIKIDKERGMAYIPKKVRETLGTEVKATPNYKTAIFFAEDTEPEKVLESLEILQRHFKQIADQEDSNESV